MKTDHIKFIDSGLATTLKQARQNKGLSQRALSAKINVPQSHISKIESGKVDIRISSLTELARALGLEIMLVPRRSVPVVEALDRLNQVLQPNKIIVQSRRALEKTFPTRSLSAYRLSDGDDDDA